MRLVVKGAILKDLPCVVNDFEEEYRLYLKGRKKWRTEEGFSLDFNTTLEDLKKCHFVHVSDKETEKFVREKLNVIE